MTTAFQPVMYKEKNISFYLNTLSLEEIERYLILNDDNLFEKLSVRLNIHEYSKKLNKNALHFTLYKYDRLIGFAPCYFNDNLTGKAYISALIISNNYQGLGLKKELLEYIKTYAKHNHYNEIFVNFHCNNLQSIKFYKENSFVKSAQNNDVCTFKFNQENN